MAMATTETQGVTSLSWLLGSSRRYYAQCNGRGNSRKGARDGSFIMSASRLVGRYSRGFKIRRHFEMSNMLAGMRS